MPPPIRPEDLLQGQGIPQDIAGIEQTQDIPQVENVPEINPDVLEPEQEQPDKLSLINKDDLSKYIIEKLREDIRSREDFGWTVMRKYDELSYAGFKQKATEPWYDSSNFSVGLTPTLVDTAHANVVGSMFADKFKIASVRGVGPEDIKNAKNVSSVLNWQLINGIDNAYDVIDKVVFSAFKNGNGIMKVIQGLNNVKLIRIPVENIFIPLDASGGSKASQSDHIFELIPMTENGINERIKDNTYEGLEDIKAGNTVYFGDSVQDLMQTRDKISKTNLGSLYSNSRFYVMECYLTYWYQPDKESKNKEKIELIVFIAPNGGKILKMEENKDIDPDGDHIRPYSMKWIPYPKEDRIYGDSLCWLVKQSQEELDYAHNQVFNATEKMIKRPVFYDPASAIDPEEVQLTPNGWYPVPNPRENIYIPNEDYSAIFQHYKSFDLFWEYAQRRTGLTELFQGRQPERIATLGEAELRVNKSEVRFKTIYSRLENGFKEVLELIYYYDLKFMPKSVINKILGVSDYKTTRELFPSGLEGKFNFSFSSEPLTEKARRRQNVQQFYVSVVSNPLVASNPASLWKMTDMLARSLEIDNIDTIISKPREVSIYSAEEAIQRIVGGELDFVPDPRIDAIDYKIKIQMFMRSEAFTNADDNVKQAILRLMQRVEMIDYGQKMAKQDAITLQSGAQMIGQLGVAQQSEQQAQQQSPQQFPQ